MKVYYKNPNKKSFRSAVDLLTSESIYLYRYLRRLPFDVWATCKMSEILFFPKSFVSINFFDQNLKFEESLPASTWNCCTRPIRRDNIFTSFSKQHTDIHTDRHTKKKQTYRQTYRQTHRHTYRQTYRKTDRQTDIWMEKCVWKERQKVL